MSQKNLRYVLIGGVIFIWGLIIFRVINGLKSDDTVVPVKKQISKIKYDEIKDSFSLFANYPDPFIKEDAEMVGSANNEAPITSVVANSVAAIEKPTYDFGAVDFKGMIVNAETKKKIAFISVNGREYTVKEGDEIEGLRVKKIMAGQVLVSAEGKSMPIHLKKG